MTEVLPSRDAYLASLAGVPIVLPLVQLGNIKIAFFDLLGDPEMTEQVARMLLTHYSERWWKHSNLAIMVPEVKAIPLAHTLSILRHIRYFVLRKERKSYMSSLSTMQVLARSVTSDYPHYFYLDGHYVKWLRGMNVILLDDVISTGDTLAAMEMMADLCKATVVDRACVFLEGDAFTKFSDSIMHLGVLPIFNI